MAGELDVGQLVSTARLNAGQYFETLDRMVVAAEEARGKIEELQFGAGAQGMREATEAARAETEALSGLSEAEREAASAGKEGAEAAREQAAADREGATAGRENAEALTADTEAEREAATAAREQAAATREAAEAGQAGAESAREQSTAEREAATAERELASAGREGATAERELGSAEKEAASAAREGSEAEREAAAAGREMGSAEKEAASAAREGASAGREAASADRELSAAETEVVSQTDALSAGQRTLREAIMAAASSEDEAVAGLRAIGTSTEEATSAYRDFQEAQRSAADSAREEAGAERDAAEGTRAESEAAREGAGAAREQAEAQRTAGESARTLGEGERGAGAAERESATAARENATAVREEGSAQGVAATAAGEHKNVLRDIAFAFFDIQIAAGVVKGIVETLWSNSIGPAQDYEQALQRVQANTFLTDTTTQALSKTVLQFASEGPAKIEDLVQAERHLNDMGFNANDSQKILEATMKVSVATGADLEKTTNLVAFAMHDYKIKADDAEKTVALLNIANKEGNTTFEQMRSALQRPIPFAQALGVSLTDVATAEAVMSRNGLTVGNTASALTNIFSHIITPSRGVEEELQKLSQITGIDLVNAWTEAGIKADGFAGLIKKTHDAIQGHNEELVKLQPNLRGTIGLITLAGDGYEEFNRLLKQNNDDVENAKQLNADYSKAISTQAAQTQILKNNTQELRQEIGQALLPAMKELTGNVNSAVKGWVDWSNHHQELMRDIGNFVEGAGKALSFLVKELAEQHFPLLRRGIDDNVKSVGELSKFVGESILKFEELVQHLGEGIARMGELGKATGQFLTFLGQHKEILAAINPLLAVEVEKVGQLGHELIDFGDNAIIASKGNDTWKGSVDNLTEHLSSGTHTFQQASETAKDYGNTAEGLTTLVTNLSKAQDLEVESQVQSIKGHAQVATLLKQEADAYKANDEPQAKYLAGQVKIQQARDDAAKSSDAATAASGREATAAERLQGKIDDLQRSIKIANGQLAEMATESPKTEDAQARLAERINDTNIRLEGYKEKLKEAQGELSQLTGVAVPAEEALNGVATAEGSAAAGGAELKTKTDAAKSSIDSLASSLKSEFVPSSDSAKFSISGFHSQVDAAKQKIADLQGQIQSLASGGGKGGGGSLQDLSAQFFKAQGALTDLYNTARQSAMSDLLEATGKVAEAMGVQLPNSISNGAEKSLTEAGGGVDTLKANLTLLASHINDTDDPALREKLSGALSTVQTGFNNMVKEGLEPARSALNVDIPKGVDATNTKLGNHISGFVKPMETGWQAAGTATEQTGKTMTEKIPPAVNTVNESLKTHRNEGLIPTETEYGNLATAGTTAINTLATNVNKGLDELKTSASEKAKAVGEGIDRGLAGGIGELSGIVIAAGEKVISDMIAAMKARAREGSPSQEGADIGKNMDAGVVQGLEGGEGGVNGAGTKVAGAAVTGLGSQTEGANSAGADLSAAAVTGFNSNDGAAHEAGISMGAAFASGLAQELNSVGGTAGHDLVQIAKSGGLSARALAGGGEITEEIWGVGVQSGQAYHLGEAGNEWVIPESGASELPGIPQGPAPMVNVTLPPAPPDPAKGKVTIPLNIYMDKKKVASAVFADVDENSVLEVTIQ